MPSPGLILLALGAIGTVGYAFVAYFFLEPGTTVHPEMKEVYTGHPIGIMLHVAGSVFALLLGPAQFWDGLRRKHPKLHRQLGYVYLLAGVFLGGGAGLYMATFAYGGFTSGLGFGLLAGLWMLTGALALVSAMRKDFRAHRTWMFRNYALTYAAVSLRAFLGIFFALGLEFDAFYPAVAWLSWIVNLLVVEWWVLRRKAKA